MSVETTVILHDNRLPSIEAWQRALDEAFTGITLDPVGDLRKFSGWLTARYRGDPSGFEWYYEPIDLGPAVDPRTRCDRTHRVRLRSGSSLYDQRVASMAGALLAELTRGHYYVEKHDTWVGGGYALDLARVEECKVLFDGVTHLTFDCYGTLVDWETGILEALRPIFEQHGVSVTDVEILQEYVRLEAQLEAGAYRPYREILRGVVAGMGAAFSFTPSDEDLEALPASVGVWPPFSDTIAALEDLQDQYGLVILSNIDDALFAATRERLGVDFTEVITAQQVGSYKPNPAHFHTALARLGVSPEQVVHVAQSLYHDHVPARALGFRTVWVNRPSRLPDQGLAPSVDVLPEMQVPDLRSLARWEYGSLLD